MIDAHMLMGNQWITCGVQCGCGGESGRVWLFDRDFQIFFEKTCPTFVDDLDFCIFAMPPVSSFLWPKIESLLQLPATYHGERRRRKKPLLHCKSHISIDWHSNFKANTGKYIIFKWLSMYFSNFNHNKSNNYNNNNIKLFESVHILCVLKAHIKSN